MMIFQNWSVVVKNGEAWVWLYVEVIGGAGVIVVMDDGGEEKSKDLQVWEPRLQLKQD